MNAKMDLVGLLPKDRQNGYASEKTSGLTLAMTTADLLSDAAPASIVLLGTSYSAFDGRGLTPEYERIFSKALSLATHRDILDFSVSGKGFWQPVADYAQSQEYKTHTPKLLLWEIPERYLSFEAPPQWAIPSFPWLEAQLTQGKNNCIKNFTSCNKNTSIMKYMLDWRSIDLVAGTGIYRSSASGFFAREATFRHAGPDKSQVTFWLRRPEKIKLDYNFSSVVGAQTAQIYLNGKIIKKLNLTAGLAQADALTLQGEAGENLLEFRYSDWNTKTTTLANGDPRKLSVTFSKLEIQRK